MNPVVIALVFFFTQTSCEAHMDDLEECSYYVHELTDEELVDKLEEYRDNAKKLNRAYRDWRMLPEGVSKERAFIKFEDLLKNLGDLP